MTKDEMVGGHHQLKVHEIDQGPGVGDGQATTELSPDLGDPLNQN